MKVTELLNEAAMGYDPERKIPSGKTSDWMAAIGATKEDLAKALEEVRKTPEYEALIKDFHFTDSSTAGHARNGSIAFTGSYPEPVTTYDWYSRETGKQATKDDRMDPDFYRKFKATVSPVQTKTRDVKLKYTVLPHGKIDFTAPNNYHRWPVASGKPQLVKGNPVASIVKSMRMGMRELARSVGKRLAYADKLFAKQRSMNEALNQKEFRIQSRIGRSAPHSQTIDEKALMALKPTFMSPAEKKTALKLPVEGSFTFTNRDNTYGDVKVIVIRTK